MIRARITLIRSASPALEALLDPARSYVIGRSPECDLCIDDAELSRRHARLQFIDNQWRMLDLGSKNGLLAGGHPTRNVALTHGQCIGMATTIARFEVLNEAQYDAACGHDARLRQLTLDGRQQINSASGAEDVLRRLLASVLSIAQAQRGFALLTQPDGDLEVACSHGVSASALGEAEFCGSRGAVRSALEQQRTVVACDIANDAALARRESILAAQTRALICLPLIVFDRVVGIIYADSREPGKIFTGLDMQMLDELAEHAAITIAAAQLGEELRTVDQRLRPMAETVARLADMEQRIPGFRKPISGGRPVPMTGVRWSAIETGRGS